MVAWFLVVLAFETLKLVTAEESSILQSASVVGHDIAWSICPDPDTLIKYSFKSFWHATGESEIRRKEAMIDLGESFKVVMVFTQQRIYDTANYRSFGHS